MKLINLSSLPASDRGVIFQNSNISLFVGMTDFHDMGEQSFVLDGLAIVFINKGHATFKVDQVTHNISENCFFMTSPRNFFEDSMLSADIVISGLFISTQLHAKLVKDFHFDFTPLAIERIKISNPLTADESRLFINYLEGLAIIEQRPKSHLNDLILGTFLQSLGLFFTEKIRTIESKDSAPVPNNSAESKVSYFLNMISTQHSNFLNVEGYARKLCISPKYFSNICKKVTGKTVGTIINEHIIREAKIQLGNPELSVKEISQNLGFVNASHFGTFLKRHTGKSPLELREMYLGSNS